MCKEFLDEHKQFLLIFVFPYFPPFFQNFFSFNIIMDDMEQHGPSNVIVALGSQKAPKKRRLSQFDLPSNYKVAKFEDSHGNGSSSGNSALIPQNNSDDESAPETEDKKTKWFCHTSVLLKESPYFAALFGENFIESNASIVFLPSSIIDGDALDSILKYMYNHQITSPKSVNELCNMYSAADYLGMESLCIMLADRLNNLIHRCICYCDTCVITVPELFGYCRNRAIQLKDERMAVMTQRVISLLANDPEKTLSTYWTSRHMAKVLVQLPQDTSQALSQKVLHRVNKSNAIESLYACFSASNSLSTSDPLLSWSKPLHATLTSVQSRATRIIATHFDFFCCQYPALLSCIDGITYSFEFLEYLLLHVLEDQMDCENVGILYQGIVCDLMSRHAVEYSSHVKHILNVARVMILCYITRRIGDIKQQGGLDQLDTNVLKLLADDLDMKPKEMISSKHPLSHQGFFSFLIPSIPDLTLSTSTPYTNGLSRHSSRSTTTSRRINVPSKKVSLAKRLVRLFKRFGHHNYSVQTTPARPHISNRNASLSTVHTTASTYSSSWLQVRLSTNKERKKKAASLSSNKGKQKRRFSTRSVPSTNHHMTPIIGMNKRVQLIRRPNLTVGTVLFIGHVDFADGIWIGVELDRRVGKNDGSVDGYRYFTSSPNRGVFVRPEDVALVF